MQCGLCGKDVEKKFYLHLNSSHHMKKDEYLSRFPEQQGEYDGQIPVAWNKGLTAADHPSVARCADNIREYSRREDVRKRRSEMTKQRYASGDILSPEVRAKVVKAGSDGWVRRIKSCGQEERTKLLERFTSAGNNAQAEHRGDLTPEDYIRLYPFAKGIARYHNCDFCGKKHIAWFGGKPRPRKRFCGRDCYLNYAHLHPLHSLPTAFWYFSSKMQVEFCLHSQLELWIAQWLDETPEVIQWFTPKHIFYEYLGKERRYYPDFFVNGKHLVEVKSGYVAKLQGEELIRAKVKSAIQYCEKLGFMFHYIQFDQCNLTKNKVIADDRIMNML